MNKLKKIFLAVAISMLGVSAANTALADETSYKEMIRINNAQDGEDIAEYPKLRGDNKLYFFQARITSTIEDGSSGLLLSAQVEGNPVALVILKPDADTKKALAPHLQELYQYVIANLGIGKKVNVVGTYQTNMELGKKIPVFLVSYLDNLRGERFNKVIDVQEAMKTPAKANTESPSLPPAEPKQEETQSPAASEQDYCKQSFEEGNMVGMTECTEEELSKEDKRLNAEYKAVMSKLDTAQKKELRTKQRAWIKARDQKCKLEEDSGQAGMLNHVSCLNEWTKKRADELAAMR